MLETNTHPSQSKIHDRELAHEMGNAMAPFMDVAVTPQKNGIDSVAGEMQETADKAAVEAGKAWFEEQMQPVLGEVERLKSIENQLNAVSDGEMRGSLVYKLTELSAPPTDFEKEASVEVPKVDRTDPRTLARVVAFFASKKSPMARSELVEALGMSVPASYNVVNALVAAGFLDEAGSHREKAKTATNVKRGGAPTHLFAPSEKLFAYIEKIPDWRVMTDLHVVGERRGLSEAQALEYCVNLGKASLSSFDH